MEHPSTLVNMNCLASMFGCQGRWKEAEELYLQVIEIRKRVLGVGHRHTLATMEKLASNYKTQGHSKEAEEVLLQVAKIKKAL